MPLLLALTSSLIWGSADFVGGLLSRTRPAYAVVAGSQVLGLLAVGLVAVATHAWTAPTGWAPWSVAAGLCGSAGLLCFYAALGSGVMGVVSAIAALGALVPVLVGTALGDRPTGLAVGGIALAVAGAVAASGPELSGAAPPRPVLLAAAAGVGFGLALTFIERGSRYSDLPALALVGIGDVSANLLFALASQRGLLSVTGVLGSLYPVVTVVLARVLLKERLLRLQQVGVVGALLGVVLVTLG